MTGQGSSEGVLRVFAEPAQPLAAWPPLSACMSVVLSDRIGYAKSHAQRSSTDQWSVVGLEMLQPFARTRKTRWTDFRLVL